MLREKAHPHAILIVVRLLLAVGVAAAMPVAHLWWGHSPEAAGVDGPVAFVFVVAFLGIGIAFAMAFVAVGSIAHWFLRRRLRAVRWIDGALGVAMVALLIWAGMSVTYSAAPQAPAGPNVVTPSAAVEADGDDAMQGS